MAEQYASFVVTNEGQNLIARIIAGLTVTFSKIVIGDGYDYDTENFVTKTSLINEVKSLNISSMQVTNSDTVTLVAEFGKNDIQDAFWYREIGIYVIDPDDETNEILFAYGNRNDAAEYITPHIQNYAVLKTIKCLVEVGSTSNVNVLIRTSEGATSINFEAVDWILDETTGLYSLDLGTISDGIKVFKTTDNGRADTALVDINKDKNDMTILKAITPFDGCVLCV